MLATAGGEEGQAAMSEVEKNFRELLYHGRKVLMELASSAEFRDAISTSANIISRLIRSSQALEIATMAAENVAPQTMQKVKEVVEKLSTTQAGGEEVQESRQPVVSTQSEEEEIEEELEEEEEEPYEENELEIHVMRLAQVELPPTYTTELGTPGPVGGTPIIVETESASGITLVSIFLNHF